MPENNASTFELAHYDYDHSPTRAAVWKWTQEESRTGGPAGTPPRHLTDIPYEVFVIPTTMTPSRHPSSQTCSRQSPAMTTPKGTVATQRLGLFVFSARDSGSCDPITEPDSNATRLNGFRCITLQTNDTTLRNNYNVNSVSTDATVGVYSAATDPVTGERGPYHLETYEGMTVKWCKRQGRSFIDMYRPNGDGDGSEAKGMSGRSVHLRARVKLGTKGHYTGDGTLVFKHNGNWFGFKEVVEREESRKAEEPFASPKEQAASEKGIDCHEGDEKSHDRSTNTPHRSVWRRVFGGGRRTLPQSTKRQ
jgi:hypothetical protein